MWATQQVIDSLIDRAPLTPDEEDYLNVLGTLVYGMSKHKKFPHIYGIELLKVLIEDAIFARRLGAYFQNRIYCVWHTEKSTAANN